MRAQKYPHWFETDGPGGHRIRLAPGAPGVSAAQPRATIAARSASGSPSRQHASARQIDDMVGDSAARKMKKNPRADAAGPPRANHDVPTAGAHAAATAAAAKAARQRRARAAQKYRPDKVKLLLIAEAPPSALDRYFYFERVPTQDSLFRYVARGILGIEPTRENKPQLLAQLRDRGVFLIDLSLDPLAPGGPPLADAAPGLVRRAVALAPEKVIVIKTRVFDAVFGSLRQAGLPVVDVRIPFPGSGQQKKFETAFAKALRTQPSYRRS